LKSKLGRSVVVLGQVNDGKVSLIAGVSKDLVDTVKAPELIALVGAQVDAKGGGRPDMARAGGGSKPEALSDALAAVGPWLDERLRQL
jgi:alanyl-tRNA synthetase